MSSNQGRMAQAKVPAGNPQMNQNQRRMSQYNTKKYAEAPPPTSWADEWDPASGPSNSKPHEKSTGRQTTRSKTWKGKKTNAPEKSAPEKEISDPAEITRGITKATKENLQDEQLWQEGPYAGTHPLTRIFPDLEAGNPRLRREISNFPNAGIPAPHIDTGDHVVEQIAGGFGVYGANNHNA